MFVKFCLSIYLFFREKRILLHHLFYLNSFVYISILICSDKETCHVIISTRLHICFFFQPELTSSMFPYSRERINIVIVGKMGLTIHCYNYLATFAPKFKRCTEHYTVFHYMMSLFVMCCIIILSITF